MDIKQAKQYMIDTVRIYLKKGENGEYRIPVVRQRPIFMLGAPGVGKTAVMEQAAQELGIALVTYSMTHHTRQSALGLPLIRQKEYGGLSVDVSEYTMSEIIASIYETMEESGIREGILFLDEINCVSETLAPSMLQFLQYKVFGRHQVPEGWVIVTAGNPPEYNKSVREFDVVTMDRLKLLEVEASYPVWKEYAVQRGIHNAVTNYLDLKKEDFYRIETTVKGRSYVTARGWEDLSQMLILYEEEGILADETLIGQYLRNDKVVREFAAYYELYHKYKKDYHIEDILEGRADKQTVMRAKAAAFDERLSLLGLLLDRLQSEIRNVMEQSGYLSGLVPMLKAARSTEDTPSMSALLKKQADAMHNKRESLQKANALSDKEKQNYIKTEYFLEEALKKVGLGEKAAKEEAFRPVKEQFDAETAKLKQDSVRVQERMHHLFTFAGEAFEQGNEMLILVTELTANQDSAAFLASFGSEDYGKMSGQMMLNERHIQLNREISLALEIPIGDSPQ